ncbi:MAG TPA: hypothetical protein VFZ58_01500 [Candidatus Saccharimonadales bacterium]
MTYAGCIYIIPRVSDQGQGSHHHNLHLASWSPAMPILLSADDAATNLVFRTDNTPSGMFTHLVNAVKAKADLCDPLAPILEESERLASDERYQQELSWLMTHAPIDGSVFPEWLRHVKHRLQLRGWLANINQLADQLVRKNYIQGWHQPHSVFWLQFAPVSHANETYHPLRIDAPQWMLFVQSVMLEHWFGTLSGQYSQPATAHYCKALQAGVLERLTGFYPMLGELGVDGEYSIPFNKPVWQHNIEAAARRYGDWLERQQRRAG